MFAGDFFFAVFVTCTFFLGGALHVWWTGRIVHFSNSGILQLVPMIATSFFVCLLKMTMIRQGAGLDCSGIGLKTPKTKVSFGD